MAATLKETVVHLVPQIRRYIETSAANTQLAMAVSPGRPAKLFGVEAKYSTSVSQTVTVDRDSGAGAAYDARLGTIALSSAASGSFFPTVPILLDETDALTVTSPAGGSGVTCALAVYLEVM